MSDVEETRAELVAKVLHWRSQTRVEYPTARAIEQRAAAEQALAEHDDRVDAR